MKITKLVFDNICISGHREVEPKDVNVIEGPNGIGKSATLKGIRALTSKGSYPDLLADGETNGGLYAEFENGVTFRRDVDQVSSKLAIKGKGINLSKPADTNRYIVENFEAESINAEAFLTEDPKEQTRLVLEAIDFKLDEPGLLAVVGDMKLPTGHPLVVIDSVHKTFYDKRTEVNRAHKEKLAASDQLAATIKSEVPLDTYDTEITQYEEHLRFLEQNRKEKIEIAENKANTAVKLVSDTALGLVKEEERVCNETNAAIRLKISELEKEIAANDLALEQFKSTKRTEITDARLVANAETEKVRSEADAAYEDGSRTASNELTALRLQRDTEVTAQAQRKIVQDMAVDAANLLQESNDLTITLRAIDEFKGNMLKELPIPGITMEDGKILIDGKPMDQVPDSRRVILDIDLAIARGADPIIIDAVEKLDDKNFEKVIKHCLTTGRQFFIGRATVGTKDDPIKELRIRTLEA